MNKNRPTITYRHFPFLEKSTMELFLSENNFQLRFSTMKKIYYNIMRPVMPLFLRHYLQEKYNNKISIKENYISEDYVNYVNFFKEEWKNIKHSLYPKNYLTATILTHDVETSKGFNFIPKVIELERKYNMVSSWNIVPYKYNITEEIIRLIRDSGGEIGIHGYNHDGKLYYSRKEFNRRVPLINEALAKYNAIGFRSPMVHRNLNWLQNLNIVYDTSCFDYDPYQPFPGGVGSIWPFCAGKFIEIPYTLLQDHSMFYVLKVKDITIWKNKIDWLVKNNGTIVALTHPDYLLENEGMKYYEDLLICLKELENNWFCLPSEMATWWKLQH